LGEIDAEVKSGVLFLNWNPEEMKAGLWNIGAFLPTQFSE